MELTIEQALQQGVVAHKEGKLQEAERLYRAILQFQPAHPDANHNLGVIAVSVNKVDAALPLFKTALEANPNVEQFWLSYIDALIKEKKMETAAVVLEQGRKQGIGGERLNSLEAQLVPISKTKNANGINPSQQQLSSLLGHYQNGRYDDAEKLAASLSQDFSEHPFGWKVLGAVLKQKGSKSEALNANRKVVALSPQDAEAHNNLGVALQEVGSLDEAEASHRQAIALKPDFVEANFNLGKALQELGRLEESEASYTQTIALKPDYPQAHNNLGNALKELGRLDEAEASYTQAIALKPDYAESHYNLGSTLKELGRLEEAEVSYTQAIALKPNYAASHTNLGNTLQELGRLDEAEASYRQAIGLKPDDAEGHYNLGNTLKELDRLDEAEASYTQAIALKPDFAKAHSNLGVTLQKLDRLNEAESSYTQAIALNPDYAEAHSNLGATLQKMGRLDESEASHTQAIALKPDLAEAHSNMGVTLQELGRLDEAQASYTQAIALKPNLSDAFWNLHSIQKTIQGAEHWIDKCLIADTNHVKARLTKAALRYYQGDGNSFDSLMQSEFEQHPFMRSCSWAFSLPNLPELHFNQWYFFDAIIKKSIISKPFYEFGVWRASSFKYLINVFKEGYGFDTFTGLPEDWCDENGSVGKKVGAYTSDGNIPDIKGGEFIVGKFEDTLPIFFSKSRPIASIINFDADLYSSTICALNYSKSVMDKDTILIFDELIMNQSWEQDEFRALNEFCSVNHCSYEVIAISFFTKQVAVKLIGI
jgi:tetratricopeptide (TPR) repeat protein